MTKEANRDNKREAAAVIANRNQAWHKAEAAQGARMKRTEDDQETYLKLNKLNMNSLWVKERKQKSH